MAVVLITGARHERDVDDVYAKTRICREIGVAENMIVRKGADPKEIPCAFSIVKNACRHVVCKDAVSAVKEERAHKSEFAGAGYP